MDSKSVSLPTSKFEKFPEHYSVLEKAVSLLITDPRILGIYLSGSFANGQPDQYSDLDINLLVSSADRESVVKDHEKLRSEVAKIATWFPAVHLNNPNQIIVFYEKRYPIHVDYEYKTPEELKPIAKGKDAFILLDKDGALDKWKAVCSETKENMSPTLERLQYFEDRFWAWCTYTDGKIKRGELWEARDAIEYIRSNVLNRLAYYVNDLGNEGNRRLERKFPKEMLEKLESTIPVTHATDSYEKALLNMLDVYKTFFDRAINSRGITGIKNADREYFMMSIKGG